MRTNLDGSKRRSAKAPVLLYKQESTELPMADEYYEPRDALQKRPLRKARKMNSASQASALKLNLTDPQLH